MSSRNEEEREKFREEYKEHYRRIREAKEKLRRSKSVRNISDAMQKMNADELLESMDHLLDKVKTKVATFESRLDIAMDQLMHGEGGTGEIDRELDEELRKQKASETLKQVKIEMGLLYEELEKRAGDLDVEKTIGPPNPDAQKERPDNESELKS